MCRMLVTIPAMTQESPSRDQDKFMVRMPEGMRERIAEAAKANNRSMNAEIVARLEESFPPERPLSAQLQVLMNEQLRTLHAKKSAASIFKALGNQDFPKTPEALAALVEKEAKVEESFRDEEKRIIRLFTEADKLLKERDKKERAELIG